MSAANVGIGDLVDHFGQAAYSVSDFFGGQTPGYKRPNVALWIGAENCWPIPPLLNLEDLEKLEIRPG